MKFKYLISAVFVVAIVVLSVCLFQKNFKPAECTQRENDANQYLFKICNYIVENRIDVSPGNPPTYNIQEITESEYKGQEVFAVRLSCCYLGDVAYIDKKSGEVVGFDLGDK